MDVPNVCIVSQYDKSIIVQFCNCVDILVIFVSFRVDKKEKIYKLYKEIEMFQSNVTITIHM